MARTWPQPQCSTGCCVYSEHFIAYAYDSSCTPYTNNIYRYQATGSVSSVQCESLYGSQPQDEYSNGGPCGNVPLTQWVSWNKKFYPGAECCSPSSWLWNEDDSNNPNFPNYHTLAEYQAALSKITRDCNVGFCLPESGGDPPECVNTTITCGAAVPGSVRVEWIPDNPNFPRYCKSANDDRCGVGCCLCDRCCDGLTTQQCTDKGGTPMAGSCNLQSVKDTCRSTNWKRPCVRGTWRAARRPAEHYPSNVGTPPLPSGTTRAGRWEPSSISRQRNMDQPGGSYTAANECKLSYGWIQRSNGRWDGKICNTYNNRCPGGKRTQLLRLKRNGGRWDWQGNYRPPCPEEADLGCNTTVGCPT
jgi:hypothetical protein